MSNEIRLNASLQIANGNLQYQSRPNTFTADQSVAGGPSPGEITVATAGTNIVLTQLTLPGMCWIQNLDTTNFVEYGIKDPGTGLFYVLGEILPGEVYILRFSRNLGEDYYNTGTGTSAKVNNLHFKANRAACRVRIDTFEA